jgi:hypothetical protein
LRTSLSKPGRLARCFLKGDAMLSSVAASGAAEDDEASAGAGVPERGEAEVEAEACGRESGSAECWRFSWGVLAVVVNLFGVRTLTHLNLPHAFS